MDLGAGLADFGVHALWVQAGAMIALALALAAAVARARRQTEARAARIAAENEALRDELWRLKEAAGARDRAEAASEAKSRFLATMSHEIRTPISGILGMADLLREASLDLENASYVEAIRSSGSALIALIDEILDLAKIEAGRFDLVVETVDLRRLTEGVVELLAPRAQSKGLEIAASFSAGAPRFVRGDGLRLRQILTNLAGNAVKFTDQGGVCVTVERGTMGVARFSVIDTGPGVPADRRAAIFDSFEQGDGSHARRFEGAGLGLAISRELVRLMGSELTLADNPGGGSIFAFAVRLPECAAVEPFAAEETRRRAPEGTRALIIADLPFEAPAMERGWRKRASASTTRSASISGLEALSGQQKPDLVIVDCALAPTRPTGWLKPRGRPAFGAASCCFRHSNGGPSGRRRSRPSTAGWSNRSALAPCSSAWRGTFRLPLFLLRRAVRRPRPAARLSPRTTTSTPSLPKKRCAAWASRSFARSTARKRCVSPRRSRPSSLRPFDVILMDLKMPGLDGYEATRRLRRLEAACGWSPTPIVALTANAFDEQEALPRRPASMRSSSSRSSSAPWRGRSSAFARPTPRRGASACARHD